MVFPEDEFDKSVANQEVELPEKEPVVTRLVSSSALSTNVETWQLSRFDSEVSKKPNDSSNPPSQEDRQGVQAQREPELKKQAELLKKEAYEKAYRQGYEEGMQQGAETGREEAKALVLHENSEALTPKLEQLDALLSTLSTPYEKLEQQVFSELTDLALHIAQQVIQQEVQQHQAWLVDTVQQAIMALPDDSKRFIVELHPEDLSFLNTLENPLVETWSLKANEALLQGSCCVKKGDSSVLKSWKTRFDEIAQQLRTKKST